MNPEKIPETTELTLEKIIEEAQNPEVIQSLSKEEIERRLEVLREEDEDYKNDKLSGANFSQNRDCSKEIKIFEKRLNEIKEDQEK